MRAADDFAEQGRDRREDDLEWVDPKRVEEVKRMIARGRGPRC